MNSARGLFFDDFEIGQTFQTGARTITSTDIVNFACLTGDFNDVHANWEYCKQTSFGEPIAHGSLVYAIMGGLQYASGVNEGTLLAVLEVDKWRMLAAVKHGDTVHMESTVVEKKETKNLERGVVKFDRKLLKHDGTIVQEMTTTIMYRRRPAQV